MQLTIFTSSYHIFVTTVQQHVAEPTSLRAGDAAVVLLEPQKPLCGVLRRLPGVGPIFHSRHEAGCGSWGGEECDQE